MSSDVSYCISTFLFYCTPLVVYVAIQQNTLAWLNQFFSINAFCVITVVLLSAPSPACALQFSLNFNDIKYTRSQFCMIVIIVQYFATVHCE